MGRNRAPMVHFQPPEQLQEGNVNARRVLPLCISAVLAALLAEGALRGVFPRSYFLDPSTETYWQTLKLERPPATGELDTVEDADLGWRMKPNYRTERAKHDERGFRVTSSAQGDTVIVIGDSYTYGLGVRDNETYASQLASLGFSVVNAGANAYGVDQAVLTLERHIDTVQPKYIVLGYFVDDFYRSRLAFRDASKPRFVQSGEGYELSPPEAIGAVPFGLRTIEALAYVWRRAGFVISSNSSKPLISARTCYKMHFHKTGLMTTLFFIHFPD